MEPAGVPLSRLGSAHLHPRQHSRLRWGKIVGWSEKSDDTLQSGDVVEAAVGAVFPCDEASIADLCSWHRAKNT